MAVQVSQVKNFLFGTDWGVDQIVGTFTGSFVSLGPTSSQNITTTTTAVWTGIPQTVFFQGVTSLDGGRTWQDFNSQIPDTTGGALNLQTCVTSGASHPDGNFILTTINYYNYNTSSSTTYTVLYKLALFIRPSQAALVTQLITSPFFLNTDRNYQKICVDTQQTLSVTPSTTRDVTGTLTVPHNLGYIPRFRVFFDSCTDSSCKPTSLYDIGLAATDNGTSGTIVQYQARVDSMNIYVDGTYFMQFTAQPAISANFYIRVYYDA